MKKRVITACVCLAVVGSLGVFAGCSEQSSPASPSASAAEGAPALQPADHDGKFERGGSSMCYGCHGNGSLANPQLTGATIIPEDHYADGSYDSKALDPARDQCLTCHPVS
ncbi:hypothetical protein [Raoultibacter massiliensis]|uniref:Diheme cytochrome c NapB n=1 Tax=Raoultibacter massiliensis TaxID=1852371 RepID=A0ABV1JAY7_9ACTN|nr:hypothetical protein [Raoultibacter massiliensis]